MAVAQRITVTLPDALHERLQRVKDALNISQVCQQAIEQVVEIEEIRLKDIPAMDKLIERLRLEKAAREEESYAEWHQQGLIHGAEDAANLSYDQFVELEKDGLRDDLLDWVQEFRVEYLDDPNKEAYLEGWVEGALGVWEEVQEYL